MIDSLKSMHKNPFSRFSMFLARFFLNKSSKYTKLIEVFDVLVTSKQRLQLFHLDSGSEYICNPNLSDYHQRMHLKFNATHPIDESVYVVQVDKAKYDPAYENYEQIHMLRFEIDRSKGTNKKSYSMKITDIDYWLEGNRHAVAHSKEFMEAKV